MKVSRNAMMKFLEGKGVRVIGTTEEFSGSKGGIWISGEEGDGFFEYYSSDYDNRTFGVQNKLNEAVEKKGWYFEWNDPGTIMAWTI